MLYAYKTLCHGTSSFSLLEGVTGHLEEILNNESVLELQLAGWELWQVNTLNDKNGNNGFILIFRREIKNS